MWGKHLILDMSAGDKVAVRSGEVISEFVKELVAAIGMKAYGEPLLKHFAEHVPEAAGYSLVQLIETSAITGHFCDKSGDAYIDIFSCKDFARALPSRSWSATSGPRMSTPSFWPVRPWGGPCIGRKRLERTIICIRTN